MSKKIEIRTKCKGTFLLATVVNTAVFKFEEPCTRPIDWKISECFRSFFVKFLECFRPFLRFRKNSHPNLQQDACFAKDGFVFVCLF